MRWPLSHKVRYASTVSQVAYCACVTSRSMACITCFLACVMCDVHMVKLTCGMLCMCDVTHGKAHVCLEGFVRVSTSAGSN
jgi:hypothetical protein